MLIDCLVMDKEKIRYIIAIIAGFLVMILFAMITVNIMELIPFFGPVVGGFVAGLIAGKGYMNGGKAAVVAGLMGAVGVGLDMMADTSFFKVAIPQSPQIAGLLFLIVALFYFPVLSLIGGVLGGALEEKIRH